MSTELALAFLRSVSTHRDPATREPLQFDTTALATLRSLHAERGRVTCELPVTNSVANRYGTLHGGCIATLVDTVGSAALVTVSPKGGVSLSINVNYLSKVALGGSVRVEAQVVRSGRTIAVIDVQLKDAASSAVVAQGTHIKFIAEAEPTMEALIAAQAEAEAEARQAAARRAAGGEQPERPERQRQGQQQAPRSRL